jgi:hypothetical protein
VTDTPASIGLNLVTASVQQLVRERAPWIGRQLQPRHCGGIEATVTAGFRWSADNGCFHGFDEFACRQMWARLAGWPGCVFVVVPDRVADHAGTLALWERWHLTVRDETGGQPLAFVAQNGAQVDSIPWEQLDCLFIGGDTAWKLGPQASELSWAAHERGVWVHMGRVNSARRIARALGSYCDSFDGTKWSRWSAAHRRTADATQTSPVQLMVPGT